LLKTIIGKASIDTKAKILLLRETVANLHVKMNEFGGDVRKFNTYVETIRDALAGRGQQVDELVAHLFRAYEQVNDDQFRTYVNSKRDKYDEDGEITADELMRLAQSKYDLIKHRAEASTLTGGNPKDKIIALEAEIQALKATMNRPNRTPRKERDSQAWKKIKPKPTEPQTKTHKSRQYHWCKKHQAWTAHTNEECRLKVDKSDTETEDKDANDQMILAKAYSAIISSSDE
jgi:hypothetical protein